MGTRFSLMRTVFLVMVVIFASALYAGPAAAADTYFASPRAMGMGGANVAAVDDTSAQYYNPAAFGFFGKRTEEGERIKVDNNDLGDKKWGLDLSASGGYRLLNDFGLYADTLSDIELEWLSQGIDTQSDLEDLINLVGSLEGVAASKSAILADVTGGGGARIGNYGLSGRGFFSAVGWVDELDKENLGLDVDKENLVDQINNSMEGFDSEGYDYRVFTSDQRGQLADAFGDEADPEEVENAIKKLDSAADKEGVKSRDVAGAVDLLSTAAETSEEGGGTLDDNTTSVMLSGFGVGEAAISYGYAMNDRWSVGGNFKFMRGRVYGNRVVVFDEDADDIMKETDENYNETNTFGVDLGVMARFEKFNLGIMGRNLNSPKFDGFTDTIALSNGDNIELHVDDVRLKPQLTAGVAYFPFETVTIAADLDLIENETLLGGYDSRKLSLGLEWDIFRILALRAGAYRNLSESDIEWVYTAGLGLNLWLARLDVAGAYTFDDTEIDGEDVPEEARVAAEISVDF